MRRAALLVALVSALALALVGSSPSLGSDNAAASSDVSANHVSIGQRIANDLRRLGWPDEAVIVAISVLPVVELRGAIPAGYVLKGHRPNEEETGRLRDKIRDGIVVYVFAVLGNMLPIPFLLLLLGPVSRFLMRFKSGRIFFEWLFRRTRRKTAKLEKYETLGLTIFVAIPLPVTGGWTGAAAAFLMGMRFHHAFLSILLGVMIAGVIMTALAVLGWVGAAIAGVALCALAVGALLQMFRREEAR